MDHFEDYELVRTIKQDGIFLESRQTSDKKGNYVTVNKMKAKGFTMKHMRNYTDDR